MKYINKIIALVVLLFISQACAELDEDTSSILTIDNLGSESDIVAALTPVYRQTSQSYRDFHNQRSPTFGADDLTTWWGGNKAPLRVFDGFDYGSGENSDINWLDYGWINYWKSIYYANTVIEGLKTSTAPEDIIKMGDGEARYLRALAYFHLVRTHGNMPIILDGYVPTGDEERATVLANYQHIEADLLIAEANLPGPESVTNVGRVSAAAAKTLLADLYLTWGGWPVNDNSKYQMAATKSKEVIDTWGGYFELLPIADLWLLENENSKESVFSVQFSQAEDMASSYAASTSFHEARGWSDAFPELQFFNDFPEGARKVATFRTEIPQRGFSQGAIFTKDPATKHYTVSQRFHPMYKKFNIGEDLTVGGRTISYRSMEAYRYAEVLLIYAEAQARGGETAASIEALNQVRRRAAGLPYMTPDNSVDVATATVDDIIAERGWELAGEYKRWFDLIRSEKLEQIAALRDPAENVPLLRQPTKAQYISPIPFQAIASSKLVQNPEGFKIQ
jgi:hypothetical protein